MRYPIQILLAVACCNATFLSMAKAQEGEVTIFTDEHGRPSLFSHPLTPELIKAFSDSIGFNYERLKQFHQAYEVRRRLLDRDLKFKAAKANDRNLAPPQNYQEPSIRWGELKQSFDGTVILAARLAKFLDTKSHDELNQVGALIRSTDFNEAKINELLKKQEDVVKDFETLGTAF